MDERDVMCLGIQKRGNTPQLIGQIDAEGSKIAVVKRQRIGCIRFEGQLAIERAGECADHTAVVEFDAVSLAQFDHHPTGLA